MGYELSRSLWGFLLLVAGEIICTLIILLEKGIKRKLFKKIVLFIETLVLSVLVLTSCLYMFLLFYLNERQELFEEQISSSRCEVEYVVILGSQLKHGKMDNHLVDRLDYFCKMEKNHELEGKYIILSGGATEDGCSITESQLMAEYLIEEGIKPEKILSESKSTTTYENIQNVSEYCSDNKSVIISSEYHLPRIWLITKKFNLNDCVLLGTERKKRGNSYHYFEEIFGIIAYFLNIR